MSFFFSLKGSGDRGKFLKENNVPSCRHNAIALYSNRGASWEERSQESLGPREKKSEEQSYSQSETLSVF